MSLLVSVIIPTHNSRREFILRVLISLKAQSLMANHWETVLVDNFSTPPVDLGEFSESAPDNCRVVREPLLGLTNARQRGFREAFAPICILVDDDNVLAPDYLETVVRLFDAHPRIGALGGKVLPEFELEPQGWMQEFYPLLALRDLGDAACISSGLRPPDTAQNQYPVACAPIGAGMAIRREAALQWLEDVSAAVLPDRRGKELTSAGDNDIVFTLLRHGWEVAYFPELRLTHLIPVSRMTPDYFARLNYGIQKSWMQVLTKHEANPWPQIAAWTVPLRKLKAWLKHRGWKKPIGHIRWCGACGHFEGRAAD